jgi:hypothetical protein
MIYHQLPMTHTQAPIFNLGSAIYNRASFHVLPFILSSLFPKVQEYLLPFVPRNKPTRLHASPPCFCPAPAAPISLFPSWHNLFEPLFEPHLSSCSFTRNLREAGAIRTSFFMPVFSYFSLPRVYAIGCQGRTPSAGKRLFAAL